MTVKKKILIVDDSTTIRKLITRELDGHPFEIFEARDGQEALDLIPEIQPDLITLDVDMPEMNGFDTCEIIRSQPDSFKDKIDGTNIPIIFVTGEDLLAERNKGFQIGCSDFITKPFMKGELISVINPILYPDDKFSGLTAIAVDDSPTVLNTLTGILRQKGLNLITGSNGKEAVELVKQNRDIDVIIMDFVMPVMDGAEASRIIREDLGMKNVPILIVSSMDEKDAILDLFKIGVTDYITKPFVKEELLARLNVHLNTQVLNRRLKSNIIDLKKLNKLKDEFLAIASHDLRSPLNGILGFTDLLMEKQEISGESKEWLKNIQDSGNFLLSLINDILDLSKLESDEDLEFDSVLLIDIYNETIEMFKYMASPKNISLNLNVNSGDNPVVHGNANALKRILSNFLSNAIKFTPDNGSVNVYIKAYESKVQIDVKDTGIGIPHDKIPFLFEKYTKVSQNGTSGEKSTGLGLAITKELIEKHGGEVSVNSRIKQGTTFSIMLPLTRNFTQPRRTSTIATPATGHSSSVLLVDDNPINLELAQMMLKKLQVKTSSFSDGAEAFAMYKNLVENKHTIPWDLILMDINMPGMDGIETTIRIRDLENSHQLPEIPIVAMTTSTSSDQISREAGMNDYLIKPVNREDIKEILKRYKVKG